MILAFIAATLLDFSHADVSFKIEGETSEVDPARSLFFDSTLIAPEAIPVPDLRERARGFQLVEPIDEEPVRESDGRIRRVTRWRLLPKPCEKVYKIAPFVVGDEVAGPIYFTAKKFEPLAGDMEVDPQKVMPPLSFRLAGKILLYIFVFALAAAALFFALKFAYKKVKEFKMSPIERALAELASLLAKGLPERGKYKDFYVELTRLVRRYVQRKYGVKAPHLTTEEFLRDFRSGSAASLISLREFMESSDMVKFAGVKATVEMASEATAKARGYLEGDNASEEAAK